MGCSASIPTTPFKDLSEAQKVIVKRMANNMVASRMRATIPSHALMYKEEDLWVEIQQGAKQTRVYVPLDCIDIGRHRAAFHVREERGLLVLHSAWET